jgi:hypothetical protein
VNRVIWLAIAIAAPAASAAPVRERCEAGARFEDQGDLARAALYLDGCDDVDGFERATRELKKKLDGSELSKLDIITNPAGLVIEIDAFPGEHVTTPATLWVRAGHHVVKGELVAGAVDVAPHAHATLVLEAKKPPAPPRDGKVNFEEDAAGNVSDAGKLPDVQHRPMLDCKYTKSCASSGGATLDDPLALSADAPPPHPHRMFYVAAGATVIDRHVQVALSDRLMFQIPYSSNHPHPFLLGIENGFTTGRAAVDVFTNISLGKVIASLDTAWLSLDVGGGGSTYNGLQAAAGFSLDLRRLPFGARALYRYGESKLHIVSIEIAYRVGWLSR